MPYFPDPTRTNCIASCFGIQRPSTAETVGLCIAGVITIAALIAGIATAILLKNALFLYPISGIGLIVAKLAHYLFTYPPKYFKQDCDHRLEDRDIIVLPFAEADSSDLPPMDKEPPIPFDYDPENVQRFLSMIPESYRENYRQVIANTQKITTEMLKRGIRQCTAAASPLFQGKDVAWGFVPTKSSAWVGAYACKFLSSPPKEIFIHAADSITSGHGGTSRIADVASSHLAIFDDAMYSGLQTWNIIASLQEQLQHTKKEYTLYLVYPFISNEALRRLKGTPLLHNLNVKLITTDYRIQTWKERCPSAQFSKELHPEKFDFYQYGTPKHLVITQWKKPDSASFPPCLLKFVTQGPNAPWFYSMDWKGECEYIPLVVPDTPPVYKLDS